MIEEYINISDNYEKQLSNNNKKSKKINGQYYTPKDVALIMSKWFENLYKNSFF